MVQTPIVLEYHDLINPNANLDALIEKAFGNSKDCLGLCFVSNVPSLAPKREELLRLASKLAHLNPEELKNMETPDSQYSFGWSHGKEIMNGKPDFAKGSFYNNPILNDPSTSEEYRKKYPTYGGPNIWPTKSLPELEYAFMDLGSLIVEVGKLVALHCDKFLNKAYPDLPSNFLQYMISKSITHKARLLHYFPISKEEAAPTPNNDSWCGLHIDHSVITGLTSAIYFDESIDSFPEIDKSNSDIADIAGLYIKNRDDSFTQAKIPADCLAFQIGEAAQIASRGLLVATPHLVRGAAYPNMARNTFAVFMHPNADDLLKPEIPVFLQSPINLALLAILGYLVCKELKPSPKIEKARPLVGKKVIIQRDFTPKELAKYNGLNGEQIYLAIAGKVYDVSSKPEFYGPGSMYENFSGRDASRGMAKHSFAEEMLTDLDKPIDDLKDLNAEERQALNEWAQFFEERYTLVGRLRIG